MDPTSARIVNDTIEALSSRRAGRDGRDPTPSMSVQGREQGSPRIAVIGITVDTSFAGLIALDQILQLATTSSEIPPLKQLLSQTSRGGGAESGLSPTAIAERLLDGLAPMLTDALHLDDDVSTDAPGRPAPVESIVIALRLAHLALWICEHQVSDPRAHELLPRAAEAAFLCASLPLRLLDEAGAPVDRAAQRIWGRHHRAREDARVSVAGCRRDATWMRTRWLELLFSLERHPIIHADSPAILDARLRRLIRRDPTALPATGIRKVQRWLHVFQADEPLLFSTDRAAFARERHQLLDLTAMHLLPRYLSDEAIGLLLSLRDAHFRQSQDGAGRQPSRLRQRVWRVASRALLPLLAAAGALALLFAIVVPATAVLSPPAVLANVAWWMTALLAGVWAVLVVVVVTTGGREGSYLAMLRMPATSAFGLAILFSFDAVWLRPPASAWVKWLPLAFIVLAGFYLFIETINQGAEGFSAALRAGLLTFVGAGTSLAVTILVMITVAPVLLGSTHGFDATMDSPTGRLWVVTLTASAAFVLGTFLQAIWDEAPVTAPLSRLRLR